jgi:hypothetical protein
VLDCAAIDSAAPLLSSLLSLWQLVELSFNQVHAVSAAKAKCIQRRQRRVGAVRLLLFCCCMHLSLFFLISLIKIKQPASFHSLHLSR